ncbi:hypothetical protein [Trinickia sp. EG282A]|uniref:hypothetical protein n=1 Tax=Trinickia sp. EG282A TaxID=3237013 RepID=UPI0034D191EB
MSTYEGAAGAHGSDTAVLALYAWNAQVSAALLVPLHVCEVVMRNAVADALESTYGERWAWSQTFEHALPAPAVGYNARYDLQCARRRAATTGKVIPELNFVFWQKMFTGRFDVRIWNPQMRHVLPYLDSEQPVDKLRQRIYASLEQVRKLRNRIAHHEPIFSRDLQRDFERIVELIRFRCGVTANWMLENQQAIGLIKNRP